METEMSQTQEHRPRYRVVIEGSLCATDLAWFDDVEVTETPEGSVLEIIALDQSQLHGFLRRLHDLRLRLISVTRLDPHS
jgi:hypothetical protein